MVDLPMPEGPDELTDAWLTDSLRAGGALCGGRVLSHAAEPLAAQGAAAVVVRVRMRYDTADGRAPKTLVAKFASPHAPIRSLMNIVGGYHSEVEFYRRFGDAPGIPMPRCYYAGFSPPSGAFVLLLEDMGESRLLDADEVTADDVELAIRHLAPFHATWWDAPRLRRLPFLRYPGGDAQAAFLERGRAALAAALPAARARFGSGLPDVLVHLIERILDDFDAASGLRGRNTVEGATVVHGDFHPGQIFFPSEAGGRFAVFDWQTVSAGSGGDDLSRIIVTSLRPEVRRAADMRLVELYHALLLEHGVARYDLEQCYDAYRLGLVMNAMLNIVASVSIEPERAEEFSERAGVPMTEAMFGWVADAIEDHDVPAVLATRASAL